MFALAESIAACMSGAALVVPFLYPAAAFSSAEHCVVVHFALALAPVIYWSIPPGTPTIIPGVQSTSLSAGINPPDVGGVVVAVNVAVTVLFALIVSAQFAVPVHAPLQPVNAEPAEGLALSVIDVPAVMPVWVHVVPQFIEPPETVPFPVPCLLTENVNVPVVQLCAVTGVPPVHPLGELVSTVRVCVPLVHVPHVEYVNDVHVGVLPIPGGSAPLLKWRYAAGITW